MALIKLGGVVTQISGKIGGQTFGTSASGSYMKNSGTPRKSITNFQKRQMSLMGTTAQRWRQLTQGQRDTFNAASPDYPYLNRVGETKFYSGYAIFGKLINNLFDAGGVAFPVPLPLFSFTPLTDVVVTGPAPFFNISANSAQANVLYRIFITKISSFGVSSGYKNFFFINQDSALIGTTISINFSTPYLERFGNIPTSGKFYWRVDAIHLDSGQIYKALNNGVYSY